MTKTTPILLTLAILALFGLSYFASSKANGRQIESFRNVVLFETKIVEKRHNKKSYNIIEGHFFDSFSNRTFTAEIDKALQDDFLKAGKAIDIRRSFDLDTIESTPSMGTAYGMISVFLFLLGLTALIDGLFINRKLVANPA